MLEPALERQLMMANSCQNQRSQIIILIIIIITKKIFFKIKLQINGSNNAQYILSK